MTWWTDEALEPVPDWKLDRLAIRLALFGRERLGLEPGERVVVMGRLGWLWPALDFAAMGFGVVPVGLEHDLSDDAVAFASSPRPRRGRPSRRTPRAPRGSQRLRAAGRLGGATVVGEGLGEEEGVLPLAQLMDLAAILDTPERAQAFRAFSRQVAPESPALWHAGRAGRRPPDAPGGDGADGARCSGRARRCEGDVAYVDAPRVTLAQAPGPGGLRGRRAHHDGPGARGRAAEDVAELRPHKVLASEPWIAAACDGRGPRWPAGLDRRRAGRRVQDGARGEAALGRGGLAGVERDGPCARRGGHRPRGPGRDVGRAGLRELDGAPRPDGAGAGGDRRCRCYSRSVSSPGGRSSP